jgi:hypothetical protein
MPREVSPEAIAATVEAAVEVYLGEVIEFYDQDHSFITRDKVGSLDLILELT